MTKARRCNIGKWSRCAKTGCEWAQQFGHGCETIHISKRKELEDPLREAIEALEKKSVAVSYFPEVNKKIVLFKADAKKKKKKKKKKNNLVATAISNILERKKVPLSDDELFAKIKVAEPDDWLKNIKTI